MSLERRSPSGDARYFREERERFANPANPSPHTHDVALRSLVQVRRVMAADAAQIQVFDPSRSVPPLELFDCGLPGWTGGLSPATARDVSTAPPVHRPDADARTGRIAVEAYPDTARRSFLITAG